MVDKNGNRIPGEAPSDEIIKHTDRHSQAVMHSFYRTHEFCAACHKANLPEQLNGFDLSCESRRGVTGDVQVAR